MIPETEEPVAAGAGEPSAAPAELPPDGLAALEAALGHRFTRGELLRTALTHSSYSNERGGDENYERLEFLGDAVLGLVTSHWLFERYPARAEGELAKLKSYLVSAPALSHLAEAIGIGALLLLGVGERRSGGHAKASILADAMEAVFGAVYLDGGLDAARAVIHPILERNVRERTRFDHADAKTLLQELAQARGWGLPVYRLAGESGPDHRKSFTVECVLEGEVAGRAEGRSKKRAEQRAAAAALAELDLDQAAP